MLYGFLVGLYIFISLILALVILIQKGKGGMGIGHLGGGTQMLFGGTGGQDIFQKTTWVLGAIFMASSFVLAIMKTEESKKFKHNLTPLSSSEATTPLPETRNIPL